MATLKAKYNALCGSAMDIINSLCRMLRTETLVDKLLWQILNFECLGYYLSKLNSPILRQ